MRSGCAASGVSHCASCDAPLLRDRVVVVVGGGDSALQEALTLAESVASVIVLQREDGVGGAGDLPRAALEHPKIEVRHGIVVEEILGDDRVTGVRARVSRPARSRTSAADAVFVYVGLDPNTALPRGQASSSTQPGAS